MQKYSLYIGKFQKLPEEVKYSYYSPKSGYLLAYRDKEIKGLKKVPVENETRLTSEEKVWLRQCKMTVAVKTHQDHEEEYAKQLNSFLDELEKELKSGSEKK